MKGLKSLNHALELPPQPLWHRRIEMLGGPLAGSAKLCEDLILTQSIILKFLCCLEGVHMRREGIMQAELPGEYVHHDAERVFVAERILGVVTTISNRL